MHPPVWNYLVRLIRQKQTQAMADGRNAIPSVFVFTADRLVGIVQARPLFTGPDAFQGIAEMSQLAAAAGADEIVTFWESWDLFTACGGTGMPLDNTRELNLLIASPGHHVLFRFPYEQILIPGVTAEGLLRYSLRWMPEAPGHPNAPLPGAIEALVEFCWRPLAPGDEDLVEEATVYLDALGYLVVRPPAATKP